MTANNRTWQELCEAASKEFDPERLMGLISELLKALDQGDSDSPGKTGGTVCHPVAS